MYCWVSGSGGRGGVGAERTRTVREIGGGLRGIEGKRMKRLADRLLNFEGKT